MKVSRLIYVFLLLPLFVLWGCEGDQGPAGPAGADGADVNVTCLACHNTAVQNAISLQYERSQHSLGETLEHAGGNASCAQCHSGNGFVEWAETGEVDGNILVPTPIGCQSCHSIHATFEEADYALRVTGAVFWIYDEGYGNGMVDFGDNSNLCANCHQSRRGEPALTNPGEDTFNISSTHWGPHHGAQANVFAGVGFAEIEGSKSYPTDNLHAEASCVSCHMADYSDGAGGHTWWPGLQACTGCHTGLTTFDRNGFQTDIEDLLVTLRDQLVALGVVEYVAADDAYEPIPGTYPTEYARAFFNWVGIEEDRSLGIHNPRYVEALLENSIEATAP
jgi:formate-dependent nitrite reductase cytochrome c552 subunit